MALVSATSSAGLAERMGPPVLGFDVFSKNADALVHVCEHMWGTRTNAGSVGGRVMEYEPLCFVFVRPAQYHGVVLASGLAWPFRSGAGADMAIGFVVVLALTCWCWDRTSRAGLF